MFPKAKPKLSKKIPVTFSLRSACAIASDASAPCGVTRGRCLCSFPDELFRVVFEVFCFQQDQNYLSSSFKFVIKEISVVVFKILEVRVHDHQNDWHP